MYSRVIRMGTRIGVSAMFVSATLFLSVMLGQPLGSEDHRQLEWKAGGCVVEFVHTPCRTVRYHEYSFGYDRIGTAETIEATDHSGSESKTTVGRWRPWWYLPGTGPRIRMTELLLRTEDQVVHIDHEHKVFESHAGANRKWPSWEEDDSQCSHTASHYLYLSGRLPDSNMANVHVVGYRGRDSRGADYEIYFAPSVGCQQISFEMVRRGFLGLVAEEYDLIVDSYVLGPPAASLYSVPAEYKQVASIRP